MMHARVHAVRRPIAVALVCSAMLMGLGQGPARATHAEVTSVDGLSYNYYTNVSLFGGPSMLRGYGQVACTAPNTPSGCVPTTQAGGVESSASPSVECPAGEEVRGWTRADLYDRGRPG